MERRHILRTQKKQAGRSRECAARPYTGEGSLRGASLRQPGGTEGRPALGVSLEPPRPKRLRGPGSERRADAWEPTFPHAPESARLTVKVSRGSQRPGLVSGDVSGKSIRPPPTSGLVAELLPPLVCLAGPGTRWATAAGSRVLACGIEVPEARAVRMSPRWVPLGS